MTVQELWMSESIIVRPDWSIEVDLQLLLPFVKEQR